MQFNLEKYEQAYARGYSEKGLTDEQARASRLKYGANVLSKPKKPSLISRILATLREPMTLILEFALIITLGVNLGNLFAGKPADFYESAGILAAILLSSGLTAVMESKSEKAFEMLEKFSENITVTAIRDGEKKVINYSDLCVGDVVTLESGDKATADGIILDCDDFSAEEGVLTGEADAVIKSRYFSGKIKESNMVWSGTYARSGWAKVLVLAVGDGAQIGKIAGGLKEKNNISAPLNQKLNKLGKGISLFGALAACAVFLLTLFRLSLTGGLNFNGVKDAFIDCIVLIVAAVPEGLPTTVAISLALSVVRLAKSNAIIKKLIAAETVGCVSVICSDKTGTLTFGKMQAVRFVSGKNKVSPDKIADLRVIENAAINSTAEITTAKNGEQSGVGNYTEQALLRAIGGLCDYKKLRDGAKIIHRLPFNSKNKYMTTAALVNGKEITYLKGSIEAVVEKCNLTEAEKKYILNSAEAYAKNAERILACAHFCRQDATDKKTNKTDEKLTKKFVFDGYFCFADEVRGDVYKAVKECKRAGIEVKMLTGDNMQTALAVARKAGLACFDENATTGAEIEKMSDEKLKKVLPELIVIARSTPETKLRVVKALKEMGEVVAVTGDGVNDAPAVQNADIGIAMGAGSEITKEASDIILIDDSFSVIVKAVAFGRNIYSNFQRFLMFQLTVNFSAVALIVSFLLLGFKPPFTAVQLLWLNVIMDGPLALSLGLERREDGAMEKTPVKRTDGIVTRRNFARIILHAAFIVGVILLQKSYDFLGVGAGRLSSSVFSLFVFFQLFNAVNSRETGVKSVFTAIGKNKLFSALLALSFVVQIVITDCFCDMFSTAPLGFFNWLKISAVCSSVVWISELSKCFYREIRKLKREKKRKVVIN